MMRTCTAIALAAMMAGLIGDAHAYVFRGRPECPTHHPGNGWKDYIAGKYSARPGASPFSVKFDRINRNIGPLTAGRCYSVAYVGDAWHVLGWDDVQKKVELLQRTGGDPQDYKMNLWGRIFTFNEAGELFDDQFGLVGTLKCELGNEC
jgi:hypothetical protein